MPKVLIIEDDPTIRTAVMRALTDRGYAVAAAHTAMSGLQLAMSEYPDVVVLDLGLPDLDGREVIRMLRAVSEVPVIVATARESEAEIVRSLDAGADDYVVKPFGAAQLDARIRAVLRRAAEPPAEAVIEVGGLRVDRRARQASLDGAALDLTPREFDLLHYLAVRAGTVVTKQELLVEVWQQPYGGADKSVDVHLSWLRRKLGETAQQPRYLHTVRRVGVRLAAPDTPGRRAPAPGNPARDARTTGPGDPWVRRRLAFLVSATMALVLVAFVVPLAILVRVIVADRAVSSATSAAQQLSAEVAAGTKDASLRTSVMQLAASSGRPVTVFQGSGAAIGSPAAPHRLGPAGPADAEQLHRGRARRPGDPGRGGGRARRDRGGPDLRQQCGADPRGHQGLADPGRPGPRAARARRGHRHPAGRHGRPAHRRAGPGVPAAGRRGPGGQGRPGRPARGPRGGRQPELPGGPDPRADLAGAGDLRRPVAPAAHPADGAAAGGRGRRLR